jgi:glucose/arabinose dehydrogenase
MFLASRRTHLAALAIGLSAQALGGRPAEAQEPQPTMLDRTLVVRRVVSDMVTPIALAFIGPDDMLVLEKNTGRVQRVTEGSARGTVLDLAVNSASERGLLGIALHPDFPSTPWVYLFWSCIAPPPLPETPFVPSQRECATRPQTGADSEEMLETPLLGNRVDRFAWDGTSLTFDRNLIQLRSFQADAAPEPAGQGDEKQEARGNHNGGVLRFGPDRRLYVQVGDTGRRGQLQNLVCGPVRDCSQGVMPDDQFGGPEPDDAHFTGVILRLDEDGNAPPDNPFYAYGAQVGGEVGGNLQKIFVYGIRNGFGMAFDPVAGHLWEQENGDDSFSELNRAVPGMNSGWVQIMGPAVRIHEFKAIETSRQFRGLQQLRWSPFNIADSRGEAMARLFQLPGSQYVVPQMSWKFEVAPGAIGFVSGQALGGEFENDLFMGAARADLQGGHLFRFKLTPDRLRIAVSDPRLLDRVADNLGKFEVTESETLLIGRDFGVVTDIQNAPDGTLYLVSLDQGSVYQITSRRGLKAE